MQAYKRCHLGLMSRHTLYMYMYIHVRVHCTYIHSTCPVQCLPSTCHTIIWRETLASIKLANQSSERIGKFNFSNLHVAGASVYRAAMRNSVIHLNIDGLEIWQFSA